LIAPHSFIRSAGTFSNLVRQAKSKQKIIDKMEAAGLIEKVETPRPLRYAFFFNICAAGLDIFCTDSILRILADFHRLSLLSMRLPFPTQAEKRTICTGVSHLVLSA